MSTPTVDSLLTEATKPGLWTFNGAHKSTKNKIHWCIYNDHLYARPTQVGATHTTWAKCGPICRADNHTKNKGMIFRTTNMTAFVPSSDFDYKLVLFWLRKNAGLGSQLCSTGPS